MKGNIAVVGDTDFVMPFSALGVDTYTVGQGKQEIVESAEKIIGQGYALVIAAENIAAVVEEAFSAQQNKPVPCILVVPFTAESQGFATQALAQVLKMATGIDIISE